MFGVLFLVHTLTCLCIGTQLHLTAFYFNCLFNSENIINLPSSFIYFMGILRFRFTLGMTRYVHEYIYYMLHFMFTYMITVQRVSVIQYIIFATGTMLELDQLYTVIIKHSNSFIHIQQFHTA